jgi:hypothetical protein
MTSQGIAAIVAVVVLGGLIVFQLLLALGVPWGKAAWGGQHAGALPANLRWGSAAAAVVLGLAVWMVLARAGWAFPGSSAMWVKIVAWVFTVYFAFNVVMNVMSKSAIEKAIMTPASAILVVCLVLVSLL